jgi:hypothetical protein
MEATNLNAGSNAPPAGKAAPRRRQLRIGAVVAVALAIGFVLWLVLRDGDSSPSATPAPTAASTTSVPVSVKGLHSLAAVGVPIYWAGEQAGVRYELTKTADNRVLLRYLPAGERIGTKTPYLTIGTYPMKNAFAVTSRVARAGDSVTLPIGHGGVAFYNRTAPTSVYVAYPGSSSQIEVYDPSAAAAHQLAFSGQVVPVTDGLTRTPPAKIVPQAGLAALAGSLRHPIYWAGTMVGSTYELSQPWNGNVFVRYLPPRVRAGAKKLYLTVGTYPVLNALEAVRRTARTSGARTIALRGGGLAVVDRSDPRSVYLAYPNSNYQVEVFDPSPARALSVALHRIAPIS